MIGYMNYFAGSRRRQDRRARRSNPADFVRFRTPGRGEGQQPNGDEKSR